MAEKVKIAILGLGVVGGGTYDILVNSRAQILNAHGVDIEVSRILDKQRDRVESRTGRTDLFTDSFEDIVNDPSINVVVETMGGVEPAGTFIKRALLKGKNVVTANKELIAKCWPELEDAAKKGGAGFYFEASCVGGVPVIRTLTQSLQGDNIEQIVGIVNGTTNYILTKMAKEGMSYADALAGAQKAGFAESNPSADVDGYDAAYKLSILSSLAFRTCIPYTSIYREGISKINISDIKSGSELGYTLKLLAIGKKNGNDIEVRVHPAFVPSEHPLAAVSNEFNAVFIKGDAVDSIMLYGRGAGARPTGSAIVSDIIQSVTSPKGTYSTYDNNGRVNSPINIVTEFNSKYFFALTLADKSGMLARIFDILSKQDVSVSVLLQHPACDGFAPITVLTHDTTEHSIQTALELIGRLDGVKSVDSLIRVL